LCDPDLCESCVENIATRLPYLYIPRVLEYVAPTPYGWRPGYEYYDGYGNAVYVPAKGPNEIFVLGVFNEGFGICGNVYAATNAAFGVCDGYGQSFMGCALIAETANSLTYAGATNSQYSDYQFMLGQGGTATITW
jgi:hypothetical protein